MPGWIFTKTKKSKNNIGSGTNPEVDKSIEEFVANKYEISMRDLADLKKFYPEKYMNWMKSISEQITMMKK
jgi:hypothetical protein